MNIAIVLAAVTALATSAGGALALRSRDRLHLVLGLSAGLLLGLVGFDLLPEVFDASQSNTGGVRTISIAIIFGFLSLHFVEQIFGSHEPAESDYGHEHSHAAHIAGTLGAIAMGGHVFLDGVAIGVAFQVSNKLGFAVFIALITHAFSDGLNTVSLLIKTGIWNKRAAWLLSADAIARIGGASFGTYITLSDSSLAIYLALFSGFLIYLATSHILPEAHSRHPSRLTMAATVIGVAAMWLVVATLG
ncbi:MAG: divalent heavy-metal cations transporter [Actinobacteria bacterium]|nr:divalent heavy-metal cations transporter [Actinomycetota bacterium]